MARWSHDGEWVYFFQIRPERTFRRVPALGGPSEAVLPFAWETHNFPQIDASGRLLSYLRRAPGEPPRAVICDLETNAERSLPDPPFESARWSRDGTELVGDRRDGTIAICPADGSQCRLGLDRGFQAAGPILARAARRVRRRGHVPAGRPGRSAGLSGRNGVRTRQGRHAFPADRRHYDAIAKISTLRARRVKL